MHVLLLTAEGSALGSLVAHHLAELGVVFYRVTDPLTTTDAPILVSAGYRHKVPAALLNGRKAVNLHTGYLPWNKGKHPNVWPLVDGTPAGVTLHWMDAGIDTGPIIARALVPVLPTDTAGTLYDRLTDAASSLFRAHWGDVLAGVPGFQPEEPGTRHLGAELDTLQLDGDTVTTVQDVVTTLRARTCGDYGCPITMEGKTVTARLTLG